MKNRTSLATAALLVLAAQPVFAQRTAVAPAPAGSTTREIVRFRWPMPGSGAPDWVINNYVDLDPGPGVLDYMGGNKTYNRHRGLDIDVPNFRWMDADFPILAVEEGTVVALEDSYFDRNTSCVSSNWNYVTVRHANGWHVAYGHMKQYSVVVSIGQEIRAGQKLGVVGSSGCSTAPHLHLEIRDSKGFVVDPFLRRLWIDPPEYDTKLGFMDAVLTQGFISNVNTLKDPPPNITQLSPGSRLGVGLSMAGGEPGDVIRVRVLRPNGARHNRFTINFTQVYRHTYWWFNSLIGSQTGTWTIEVRVNGSVAASYPIAVDPP